MGEHDVHVYHLAQLMRNPQDCLGECLYCYGRVSHHVVCVALPKVKLDPPHQTELANELDNSRKKSRCTKKNEGKPTQKTMLLEGRLRAHQYAICLSVLVFVRVCAS